jgi:hypothetical protein
MPFIKLPTHSKLYHSYNFLFSLYGVQWELLSYQIKYFLLNFLRLKENSDIGKKCMNDIKIHHSITHPFQTKSSK